MHLINKNIKKSIIVAIMMISIVSISVRTVGIDEKSFPYFAVFSTNKEPTSVDTHIAILAGENRRFPIQKVETLNEAVASKAEVLILLMDRSRGEKITSHILDGLKTHKVIGIGYGAAQVFGELGLEINGDVCAHGLNPKFNTEKNTVIKESEFTESIVAFNLSSDARHIDYNFGMFIPRKSRLCSVVDVIARLTGDENYAPIVHQGNYIMVGLAAPPVTWTPIYRKFFRELAITLHARKSEPFSLAKWEVTEPGTYNLSLAKGRSTVDLFGKTFYFQFTNPTTFSAHLEHAGSNDVMLLFMNEKGRRHWTRKNAYSGEPLDINIKITKEDIESVKDRYWKLNVTNFDSEHTADCVLRIEY